MATLNLRKPTLRSVETRESPAPEARGADYVMEIKNLNAYYGDLLAIKDINLRMRRNSITAVIGPSGCGKSTLVRCLNRMHELVPGGRIEGSILFNGEDINAPNVDPVELRSTIGMVFQKPNPFPKSIFDNVAFGLRINGYRGDIAEAVERSLRQAALWDEVKDRLKRSALALSGGQQQRLCIARAIAIEPEVILMDEPCSALDPIATLAIEDLIRELRKSYTIAIVTHNMQQAARVSDETAFLMVDEDRAGFLVEFDSTERIFTNPSHQQTEAYITGRFS